MLLHPGHDHLLLLGNAPNSRNTVAVTGRLFKFQVFRRCLHPFGEQTLRVLSPFGQELQRLFQALVIFLLGHTAGAGSAALLDIKIEAGPVPPHIPRKNTVAGGKLENTVDLVHRLLHRHGTHIGTQIPGAVVGQLPRFRNPGIGRRRNSDIVIALAVLQQNVVFGRILLDQRTFQYQRFKLAVRDDVVKMIHLPHHAAHLLRMVGIRPKILTHPVFQRFGFADVDEFWTGRPS